MNTVYKCGNETLLERRKTAFLCSRKTPVGVEKAVDEWMNSLRADYDCVMCGDQSGMERRVFAGLLSRGIPTILVLAEALPVAWNAEMQDAMSHGRLLAITHCDASVHWANARSAHDRNMLMIALAAEVVVGYCTEGGNLSRELANAREVKVLYSGAEPYRMPHQWCEGMAGEIRKESRASAAKQWKQRMWGVNGALTIEKDDSAAAPCFRIWQMRDFDVEGSASSKITLSPRELADFHEALGEVIIQVGNKELGDIKEMTVSSAGGDVTFEFKTLTDDGLLVITQTAKTKFMGVRKRSVLVSALEIRGFYEKVSEAVVVASKLL